MLKRLALHLKSFDRSYALAISRGQSHVIEFANSGMQYVPCP